MNLDYFTEAIKQIRKATEELKASNDAADWAEAERNEKLLEGLKAYPESAFKVLQPDGSSLK